MNLEEHISDVGYEIRIKGTRKEIKMLDNWLEDNFLNIVGIEWGLAHLNRTDSMWIEFNTREHNTSEEYMGFKLKWF